MSEAGRITRLISHWQGGDEAAFEELLPLVYQEMRSLAAGYLSRERSAHTLQPTALVHEAWMRMLESGVGQVDGRNHFFAAAAQAMRRILVEHARRHSAQKRGDGHRRITLAQDGTPDPGGGPAADLLDVNRALDELGQIAERQAKLVELRYFGGLTVPEAAEVLKVSRATAEREWTAARIWLRRRLQSYA